MDPKASALSRARDKIISIQQQMTNQTLAMAEVVSGLIEQTSVREARSFLRTTSGLAAGDLSTYVKFSTTLKGHEDTLRKGRVTFAVMKSLISAEEKSRSEALKTIAGGGHLEPKDVAAIRRQVRIGAMTPQEAAAKGRLASARSAARKNATRAVGQLDADLRHLVRDLDDLATLHWTLEDNGVVVAEDAAFLAAHAAILSRGQSVLAAFENVYGSQIKTLQEAAGERCSLFEMRLSKAHQMLQRISQGRFGHNGGYSSDAKVRPPAFRGMVDSLFAVTSETEYVRQYHQPRHAITADLKQPPVKLSSLELCAGAGGLALGFEAAGFEPRALVERNPAAVATLKANRPNWNVIEHDLTKLNYRQYMGAIDVLTGGLPCQPWSSNGKSEGSEDNRDLFKFAPKIVAQVLPRAFVFENVFGFNFDKYAGYRARIFADFAEAGYATTMFAMDAKNYGVAQERPRVFIVGMSPDDMARFRAPPIFEHWHATLGDALEDQMGERGWLGASAWAQARREQVIMRNGRPEIGALISTIKAEEPGIPQAKEAGRALEREFSLGRSREHAPTNDEAIRGGPNFRPGLTIRMKKRLMGFPDDFILMGDRVSQARQLGNAVVPRVAQAVALAVYAALERVEFDWEIALRSPKLAYESVPGARLPVDPPPLDGVNLQASLETA
ncbi:DNA cytosine methyltransferase [Rhizobium leguminosarum]|uniref:DNA cytosine methyltransferase n=1 Tax=Rhizobium leguminosarum TaxID=384 RepID=UPI001C93E04C|nr:DNA cytosine methyltransferase [Rhizobium leguminosarum]MBY5591662.1 DNA cytosine methyltransferase [Rhizobium leguminosarum]